MWFYFLSTHNKYIGYPPENNQRMMTGKFLHHTSIFYHQQLTHILPATG